MNDRRPLRYGHSRCKIVFESKGVSDFDSGREPTFLLRNRNLERGVSGAVARFNLDRIREVAERVAASEGMELVDVEMRGSPQRGLLRIFIDKPGGVTHGDCEVISNQVGAILEVEDLVPGSYTLEVSSPGLERRLHRAADFDRFAGKKVKLILKDPMDGRRQFTGLLEGIADGAVTVKSDEGQRFTVPLERIERANLVFEWK